MNRKGFRDPRFEDLAGYALGALSESERANVEQFVACSEDARRELASLEEAAAAMASAAPEVAPTPFLKQRILTAAQLPVSVGAGPALVDADRPTNWNPASRGGRVAIFVAGGAVAAAIASIAAVFAVALTFNAENNQLQQDMAVLRSQVGQVTESVAAVESSVSGFKGEIESNQAEVDVQQDEVSRLAQANSDLQSAIKDQRWLTYVTFARDWETQSWFRPGPESPQAQGQIVVSPTGDRAVLLVDGLPPLPEGTTYYLWLTGAGWSWPAASFEVNETGYARVDVTLPQGLALFTSAAVTREASVGSATGDLPILEGQASR